jgi:hypothetical protein
MIFKLKREVDCEETMSVLHHKVGCWKCEKPAGGFHD